MSETRIEKETTSVTDKAIKKRTRLDLYENIAWLGVLLCILIIDYGIEKEKVFNIPLIKDHMEKQVIKNKLYEEYLKNQKQ